jgi:hypothetical protein
VAAAGLEEKGQGPVLPSRSRRARAGVHACVLRGVHRRAREGMFASRMCRGARHDAATTGRAEAYRKEEKKRELGGRRAR